MEKRNETSLKIMNEVDKITISLSKLDIILKPEKEINYGVVYVVHDKGISIGKANVYFSKKGFTISSSPPVAKFNDIKRIFEERDNNTLSNESSSHSELRDVYNKLSKYRNEEFDFILFAEKLNKHINEKEKVINNRYDFEALEKLYMKIVGE